MSVSKFSEIGQGAGRPVCVDETGNKRIFNVIGVGSGSVPRFRISGVTPYGSRVLSEAGIRLDPNGIFSKTEFQQLFKEFTRKGCGHVVQYSDKSDSLQQSRVVSAVFYFGG
jgi:hypothetical protein